MRRSPLALVALAALLGGSLAACGGGGDPSRNKCIVKLGSIFSLTGAASAFGSHGEKAVHLAVKDAKAKGFKVGGKSCTFDYKAEDLVSEPNNAATTAQNLIQGFGAKVIIGPRHSRRSASDRHRRPAGRRRHGALFLHGHGRVRRQGRAILPDVA